MSGIEFEASYHCKERVSDEVLAPVLTEYAWTSLVSIFPEYQTEVYVQTQHDPDKVLADLRGLGLTVATDDEAAAPWDHDHSKETDAEYIARCRAALKGTPIKTGHTCDPC